MTVIVRCECGYRAEGLDDFSQHIIERYRSNPEDQRHWELYAHHWNNS